MLPRIPRVLARSFTSARALRVEAQKEAQQTITETATSEAPKAETPAEVESTASDVDFINDIHNEAVKMTRSAEKELDRTLHEILTGETTSPLTERLSKNETLRSELKQFVEDYTLNLHKQKLAQESKRTLGSQVSDTFPHLEPSLKNEPYTTQELFLRKKFIEKQNGRIGAIVKDVYIPHREVAAPPSVGELSVAKLLAAGAHLGHSKSLYRSSNQKFIYGEYKGIHIIDLEQTLQYLKRACNVAEGVASKGGIVLFVGTRKGSERILEKAATRCGGYYVSNKWVPGTLTNSTEISKWARMEVTMGDLPTGRELSITEQKTIVKPDLIVVLNPTENRVLLQEAMQTRVPTIGIIDTDSEASLVTYPIPANDDSTRAVTLIAGVLSKAAQAGQQARLRAYQQHVASQAPVAAETTL
ncbi:hypothetical protein BON22_3580 [Cyberlindnera fabianii]|uniref:37S ribosomal protein MRP4, mitochondrial n=1 Tax=Cyberlindnera fabianii TaxID=36022 RepID=A0A1V2L4V4_CYBFA|nr:hypothetical protein BON22_3580 [Cyberlindnera fabianii]